MKNDMNMRNRNKFYLFLHDHKHETNECHALKKKDRKIDRQWLPPTVCEKRSKTRVRKERSLYTW